jgi:hypothetical protein
MLHGAMKPETLLMIETEPIEHRPLLGGQIERQGRRLDTSAIVRFHAALLLSRAANIKACCGAREVAISSPL